MMQKMWVEIDKDIFEKGDLKGLNYLYQILSWSPLNSNRRYNIFIDIEKIKHSPNYKKLKEIENKFDELIEAEFNKFITENSSNTKRDYTVTLKKIEGGFNIEESIRFFKQPVSIVLENNKNDAYFIKAIIYHFDRDGIINEHLKNGWIKFENAGGCSNVENFIEGELKQFEDIAIRNGKETSTYYRGLVILDSDKEYPTQPIKSEYDKLTLYLNSISIDFHILLKRAMENYMPDEVFDSLRNEYKRHPNKYKKLLNWINAYLNLSPSQKDFLNISSGFPKDMHGNLKPFNADVQNLFSNVSNTNLEKLKNGFKYPDFKNNYPQLFENNKVNKATLKTRMTSTAPNESQDILNKINKKI